MFGLLPLKECHSDSDNSFIFLVKAALSGYLAICQICNVDLGKSFVSGDVASSKL